MHCCDCLFRQSAAFDRDPFVLRSGTLVSQKVNPVSISRQARGSGRPCLTSQNPRPPPPNSPPTESLVNCFTGALGAQRLHRFNGAQAVSPSKIRCDCPASWATTPCRFRLSLLEYGKLAVHLFEPFSRAWLSGYSASQCVARTGTAAPRCSPSEGSCPLVRALTAGGRYGSGNPSHGRCPVGTGGFGCGRNCGDGHR